MTIGSARPTTPSPVAAALRAAGVDVETSTRRLAEYSYDASNYRVRPLAVVFPHSAGEVRAVMGVCRERAVPLVPRGGGTSMAGNAIGPGVVLDLSRNLNGIRDIDETARTVDVDPGVVLSELTAHVEQQTQGRLTFAPDPSSRTRAVVGGAIGNDACGNHSVRHGRTSDHVVELDVVTSDGSLLTAYRGGLRATDPLDAESARRAAEISEGLTGLAQRHRAALRTELGRIPRQVSGYHLAHLLPEHGFDLARALVGTEGTCVVVVGARMRLVERPGEQVLVVLGYDDVVAAARDVPHLLALDPAAIEGIDEKIVKTMRWRRGPDSVAGMPSGRAWLFVELDGSDRAEVEARARAVSGELAGNGRLVDALVVTDPAERALLWRVREDGAGLSSRLAPEPGSSGPAPESWPGWEDSAVAPERLADYLAELRTLLDAHGLDGVMYGHFGAGCMHIRITFDLRSADGRAVFERFLRAAAELVVAHGGSISGEHGDGRARSELLPLMYSAEMLGAFADYQQIWDPAGVLSCAGLATPAPLGADLALSGVPERTWDTVFDLGDHSQPAGPGTSNPASQQGLQQQGHQQQGLQQQGDDFVHAVQGCIGVGRCRTSSGGVMCPSYRATRDEKDSTRGRARVLQEMVRSAPSVGVGWQSPEVAESLDLCLSCKACSTDCPTGVDMATLKSEFLHHHYAGRLRPRSHYVLGALPRWLGLARAAQRPRGLTGLTGLTNRLMNTPLARGAMLAAGLTSKRSLPNLAPTDAWARELAGAGCARPGSGTGSVVVFVDTFTRAFRPEVAGSVVAVVGAAGETVECSEDACCGLTWISTGQLDTATAHLTRAAQALDDGTDRPIVVPEPSCAAALRHDLPRLVHSPQATRVAARVHSFAAYAARLAGEGRLAPAGRPLPERAVVQTHCHEYATFGATVQTAVLRAVGVTPVEATGCCGVAGNFGFEAEHYSLSVAVAEQALVPAIRATGPTDPVLTDGFSCAMQVDHLAAERSSLHLAQLIDPRKDPS